MAEQHYRRRPQSSESSRCRTPGCVKYHDFFQWNGKYYCLECYETLRSVEKEALASAVAASVGATAGTGEGDE